MKIKKINRVVLALGIGCYLHSMEETPVQLNPFSETINFRYNNENLDPERIELILNKQRNTLSFNLTLGPNKPEVLKASTIIFEKNNNQITEKGIGTYPFYPLHSSSRAVRFNKEKKLTITSASDGGTQLRTVTHNTPVATFGTIGSFLVSGSVWPSIKKTSIKQPIVTLPFINNAFLLACKDNGMVIAKIDEKDNGWFWLYRRFGIPYKCNVTLYALFFDIKKMEQLSPKVIDAVLKTATHKYDDEKGKLPKNLNVSVSTYEPTPYNMYTAQDIGITVVTLARNVQLEENIIQHPEKWPFRAAVSQDSAIVVHIQKSSPKNWIAFCYKNEKNMQNVTTMPFDEFLGKKAIINAKNLTHPYIDEIKHIYLYYKQDLPYTCIVTHMNHKYVRSSITTDGIYTISLPDAERKTPDERNISLQWHVPIGTKKNSQKEIITSAFDYAKNILYFVTKSKKAPPAFKLYTLQMNELVTSPYSVEKRT